MPEARRDPYLNFNFLVEIDGVTVAGFAEAELPDARIEMETYREGSERINSSRRLPAGLVFGPLVLRRGFDGDRTLFQWWRDVADGNVERRNVVIVLRDQGGREVARWNFRNGLPTKYTGPSFNAKGTDIAMESLELVVEDMQLEV